MDIKHVVVLMLENRSFDCMLGWLYHGQGEIDGLDGTQQNPLHRPDGTTTEYRVWSSNALTPEAACIPNPDPGEYYADIKTQIQGMLDKNTVNAGAATMNGFVDNYMRQPVNSGDPPFDPSAVMHYFTPAELPAMSALAEAFAVSDRWHASAPNQTWPNRFFAHTATAAGYVNNSPTHFPYMMETVFNRLDAVGKSWRVYFTICRRPPRWQNCGRTSQLISSSTRSTSPPMRQTAICRIIASSSLATSPTRG